MRGRNPSSRERRSDGRHSEEGMGAVHASTPTPSLKNQGDYCGSTCRDKRLDGSEAFRYPEDSVEAAASQSGDHFSLAIPFKTSSTYPVPIVQLFGFAYGGPFGHFLHKLLDIIFKGKRDTKTVAKKVLLEQLTSSPWNNLLFLFYFGLVVERRPWPQVKNKIKKEYPSV
ncbi:uncharacterized protein [Typha angustifolia]|uniref:uncharacterized protein n=1 Tax=Typha angustifolia TaxID=59011 RepID=UPI003C30970B